MRHDYELKHKHMIFPKSKARILHTQGHQLELKLNNSYQGCLKGDISSRSIDVSTFFLILSLLIRDRIP